MLVAILPQHHILEREGEAVGRGGEQRGVAYERLEVCLGAFRRFAQHRLYARLAYVERVAAVGRVGVAVEVGVKLLQPREALHDGARGSVLLQRKAFGGGYVVDARVLLTCGRGVVVIVAAGLAQAERAGGCQRQDEAVCEGA